MAKPALSVVTNNVGRRTPIREGFLYIYRTHETNVCPGCGRRQWWVGRITAECAFCSTALELDRPHG